MTEVINTIAGYNMEFQIFKTVIEQNIINMDTDLGGELFYRDDYTIIRKINRSAVGGGEQNTMKNF